MGPDAGPFLLRSYGAYCFSAPVADTVKMAFLVACAECIWLCVARLFMLLNYNIGVHIVAHYAESSVVRRFTNEVPAERRNVLANWLENARDG